ncbi:MAG TPA: hypothetical protein VK094_00435 [Pseudogracilibacillus sp.]|nr:hypothetical protein [Pseudogracilibacillus sp.]
MTKEKRQITVVEVAVSWISIGWAVVMFTNNQVFEQSENFNRLELIAQKEWVLGVVCLILAAIKIVGIFLNISRFRWLGLILSAVFWAMVSATFILSGNEFSFNTGFIVYSAVSILCLWTSKEVMLDD